MFTGIIEEIGRVAGVTREGGGVRLTVEAPASAQSLKINDSVSLNGACQTVIERSARAFTVQAVEETLSKTTLGEFVSGSEVNLELPVRLNERLGGHLVLGHVDCVGTIAGVEVRESSRMIAVSYPASFAKYVIPVGSIAVDGISLTVASAAGNEFTVSVIPHTLSKTTLSRARKGMRVNLEFDVIGKYVEKLVMTEKESLPHGSLTAEKLRKWGYNI
ncbi:MAG TPA: riboflavin synthase [Bacteroidota bacterium]|nr:riboflavin synthase [Bacteroidota bacterium]